MSLIAKKLIREDRIKSIYAHLIDWTEKDVEIFKLNPYQYRFIQRDHIIDYFPTSGKYHDLNLNKWGFSHVFKLIELFT